MYIYQIPPAGKPYPSPNHTSAYAKYISKSSLPVAYASLSSLHTYIRTCAHTTTKPSTIFSYIYTLHTCTYITRYRPVSYLCFFFLFKFSIHFLLLSSGFFFRELHYFVRCYTTTRPCFCLPYLFYFFILYLSVLSWHWIGLKNVFCEVFLYLFSFHLTYHYFFLLFLLFYLFIHLLFNILNLILDRGYFPYPFLFFFFFNLCI